MWRWGDERGGVRGAGGGFWWQAERGGAGWVCGVGAEGAGFVGANVEAYGDFLWPAGLFVLAGVGAGFIAEVSLAGAEKEGGAGVSKFFEN